MPDDDLYACRWGRVPLWVARASTDRSRSVVTISPAQGDDHAHQDRGSAPSTVRCDLLFDEDLVGAIGGRIERLSAFDAQVHMGEPLVFVHPLHGSYLARVTDWSYTIDEDSNITEASATFLSEQPATPILIDTTGAPIGGAMVTAAADNLELALSAVDIEGDVPAIAKAAVASWDESEDAVPTREVLASTADMTAQTEALIADNGLEDDLALYDAWVAAIELQAAFYTAARAATASTRATFRLLVAAPSSPLALAARVYGGAEAEVREAQIRALNDLVTVGGMIQAGTQLTMPAVGSSLG